MPNIKARPRVSLLMLVGLLALAGCSGHQARAPDAGGEVVFPDPARSTMPEGSFVNIDNLRQVGPGLSKQQLYDLLGVPHFSEGAFGVREWNYIFDFRRPNHEVFSCQYQIRFDEAAKASAFYWKPSSCKSVIAQPEAPVAVARPVAMPAQPIRLEADALFDFDSADLTEPGRGRLSDVLQQIRQASKIENILVIGYTDRIGSDSYNRGLSKKRAESVRNYLVSGGVASSAIQVEGRGEADPIAACSHQVGDRLILCLAPNRRVELSGMAGR